MKRISASYFLVLLLLIANLRGSLGYIYRFGDPATSPAYSAVPREYFLLWYATICSITILLVSKIKKISVRYAAIYLLILLFSFVCLLQAKSYYVLSAAHSMILYGFLFIVIVSNESWIKISYINKAIEFMSVFGIFFLLYQLCQYHFFGMLPTHSHKNSLIRYGSFYNDSLALGIMLPMFTGYFFKKYQSIPSSLLIAAIVSLVAILTGSITAIGIVFLYIVWNFRKRFFLLLPFFCVILFLFVYFKDQIHHIWSFKGGSIAGHFEGLSYLKDLNLLTLIGFQPLDKFAETGYLLFLYNFGVFTLITMLIFHLRALLACRTILLEETSSREIRVFAGAVEGLTISVLLANINLPPIVYPPVYLMVVILSAIAIKRSKRMKLIQPEPLCE